MGLVTTAHLEQWANRVDARHHSGELIRKLIHANLPLASISRIRFLANEATQLAGWDGMLSCTSDSPWIPNGNSVWELGVGASDRAKVRSDFNKRKGDQLPDGWKREETTYVAVSFRKFSNKTEFQSELQGHSVWKEVVIIDGADLEEWIDKFYCIQAWLKTIGVINYAGVESLSGFWDSWVAKTDPEIQEALLLHAREELGRQFKDQFDDEFTYFTVQSDSPDESLAFSYAVIATNPNEQERENYLSKCIVVNNVDDARAMLNQEPHIIFLINNAISEVRVLGRAGHKVVVANGRKVPKRTPAEIEIKRLLRSEFSEALQKMGLNKEDAERDSRACGASVGIWRVWNQLEIGVADSELPNWASIEDAEAVIPAVLVGGWDENWKGDIAVIEQITGCKYEEYSQSLLKYLNHDDPLLVKVGSSWVVAASATAFALVVHNISRYHLQRFEQAIEDVFSEVDPSLQLSAEDESSGKIAELERSYSDWLRDGLAETLLKISVLGERLEVNSVLGSGFDRQSYVDDVVSRFSALRGNPRMMASLGRQMPVLAEAAPMPFMVALDSLIQGDSQCLVDLLCSQGGIYETSYLPYFLWSLETLAWEPNYFSRVCLILIRLAGLGVGAGSGNSPINSLKEIFLPWNLGTAADLSQRLEVLRLMERKAGDKLWELMEKLFPEYRGVSFPTNEPKWKDFSRSEIKAITNKEVYLSNTEYLGFAISIAGLSPERWDSLIRVYSVSPAELKEGIIDGLRELTLILNDPDDRFSVWSALREVCNSHREFPDAEWSMAENDISALESLSLLFENSKDVRDVSWLFDAHFPDIGKSFSSHKDKESEITKMREEAVRKVIGSAGVAGLVSLAQNSVYPIFVVRSISKGDLTFRFYDDCTEYFDPDVGSNKLFFTSLSRKMFDLYEGDWNAYLLQSSFFMALNDANKAIFFTDYPDEISVFESIAEFGNGVEDEFWKMRPAWFSTRDEVVIRFIAHKLMECGRSYELPSLITPELDKFSSEFAFNVLDDIYTRLDREEVRNSIGSQLHSVVDIFKSLKDSKVDTKKLAGLEYKYLPFLDRHYSLSDDQLALHRVMSEDADFFVDLLVRLYKPSSSDSEEILSEESRSIARTVWMLLRSWKTPPGLDLNGCVDVVAFNNWICKVRVLAAEKDRIDSCDLKIGEVLFFLPVDDEDGIWPHRCLRELLENTDSTQIEAGIELAQFNSRGVVSKSVFEGGEQEIQLAEMWQSRADELSVSWPKAGALCLKISQRWRHDAAMEDERAEQLRLRG